MFPGGVRGDVMSFFDTCPRWANLRLVLTVPPSTYVSINDDDETLATPGIGIRPGLKPNPPQSIPPSPASTEAVWGGPDFASVSSPLIQLHRSSFLGLSPSLGSPFGAGVMKRFWETMSLAGTSEASSLPSPSSVANDDVPCEGVTGRDLVAMLRDRIKPLAHYVTQQATLTGAPPYAVVLAAPADPKDELRIARDVGRTFAAFGTLPLLLNCCFGCACS